MEDFRAAFLRCAKDVDALHKQKRYIAAMHFGGIAIECLLKHMILASLPNNAMKDWYDGTDKTKNYGHSITNPKHSYDAALKRHQTLKDRIERTRSVKWLLKAIEEPDGCPFIDMRYSCKEPEEKKYKEWREKYRRLKEWLLTEGMKP